jgi:hypothetical protein
MQEEVHHGPLVSEVPLLHSCLDSRPHAVRHRSTNQHLRPHSIADHHRKDNLHLQRRRKRPLQHIHRRPQPRIQPRLLQPFSSGTTIRSSPLPQKPTSSLRFALTLLPPSQIPTEPAAQSTIRSFDYASSIPKPTLSSGPSPRTSAQSASRRLATSNSTKR